MGYNRGGKRPHGPFKETQTTGKPAGSKDEPG